MWFLHLHDILTHFWHMSPRLPEMIITAGAILLIGSAASCICSPCEEKDDLFHHETF